LATPGANTFRSPAVSRPSLRLDMLLLNRPTQSNYHSLHTSHHTLLMYIYKKDKKDFKEIRKRCKNHKTHNVQMEKVKMVGLGDVPDDWLG
jgi:hypothetical protein